MHFVYLDEFGHIGPFVSRASQKYNESPVFGVAGFILPESAVRSFATFFLQLKEHTFEFEIKEQNKIAAKWEKKGTSFIRPEPLRKYVNARRAVLRTIDKIRDCGGHVFYYGREKRHGLHDDLNPVGLYTTCFAHALRRLDDYCAKQKTSFVVVVDEHSARKELLECSFKTMYGSRPCRNLASPPFEAESYINQNVQAADWIATLIGRLGAYKVCSEQYQDYAYIDQIFSKRVDDACRNSSIDRRPATRDTAIVKDGPFSALKELLRSKQ